MRRQLLHAFERLRAEDEPWLDECFVAPTIFEQIMDDNSVLISGEVGAGKTALYEMLKRSQITPEGCPARLFVEWRLTTPTRAAENPTATVAQQVEQLYDLIAVQLATFLAEYPDTFQTASPWAQQRIGWFIHTFLHEAPHIRLGRLLDQPLPGVAILRSLLSTKPVEILFAGAPPEQALNELIMALEPLGLLGIWVLLDDVERLMPVDQHLMIERLLHLLGTQVLFERSALAFKLFVPAHIVGDLSRASSVERDRIGRLDIRWTVGRLTKVVERRLQLVTGDSQFTLVQLCDSPHLLPWLEKAGGLSPRHWLDQVQPLVRHYLEEELSTPISEKTWRKLRAAHPPRFRLYRERQRVVVGGREIELNELPVRALDMLEYLYTRPNEVVPKPELYYRGYMQADSVPRAVGDQDYKGRKEYEGVIDTNLYRLRKAIEPLPEDKEPVLLQTLRGHGIRLQVRW